MKERLQSNQILKLLFWETTIKCNLTCAHCRRLESNEASIRDLSTVQAKHLIGQLAELGKRQLIMPVLVFSGGEPICRPDLFELVGQAQTAGIIPAIATNGTLIDAKVAQQIQDSGIVRVAVSLDGATAEVHDKLRLLQGAFERALEGISYLCEKNVPFQINVTLTRHNAEQLADIYELAESLGAIAVHIFMLVPLGCGQVLAQTDMLSPQQIEQKMLEICRLDRQGRLQVKVTCAPHYERVIRQQGLQEAHRKRLSIENRKSKTCPEPSRRIENRKLKIENRKSLRGCLAGLGVLFVGHQGDVFPCGYLPVKCGNVLQNSLVEIWYGNKDLARMRDSSSLEGKCGVCHYSQVCGGCRGRAYAATGNYMAEEPLCAYVPPKTVH